MQLALTTTLTTRLVTILRPLVAARLSSQLRNHRRISTNPFAPGLTPDLEDMSFPAPPPLGPSQGGSVPNQGPAKIHLWTAGTPNGYKASVTLEELREAYPDAAKDKLSYDVSAISIWKNEQKVSCTTALATRGRAG